MEYTGNMSALLIAEYRISQMKEKGISAKRRNDYNNNSIFKLSKSNSKRIWT